MKFIKLILFHILLSLRGIILCLRKLFAIIFFIFGIAVIVMKEFQAAPTIPKIMVWGFAITFTFINWFYDEQLGYQRIFSLAHLSIYHKYTKHNLVLIKIMTERNKYEIYAKKYCR